jgi:hypothetical protein
MGKLALLLGGLVLAPLAAQTAAAPAAVPAPIDFAKVERRIGKLPQLGPAPRYGLYLFGVDGQTRVWAVLDQSDPKGGVYDLLYLDANANGDLTEPGERFVGKPTKYAGEDACEFAIGTFAPPAGGAAHKDFTITWTLQFGVRFKMLWHGDKVTFGGYGPTKDTYAPFGESVAKAPVFVPGYDRPLAFESWMPDKLHPGKEGDVEVFVGNRGDRTGAFSSVDDKFVALEDSPVATLLYEDRAGAKRELRWELRQRC